MKLNLDDYSSVQVVPRAELLIHNSGGEALIIAADPQRRDLLRLLIKSDELGFDVVTDIGGVTCECTAGGCHVPETDYFTLEPSGE